MHKRQVKCLLTISLNGKNADFGQFSKVLKHNKSVLDQALARDTGRLMNLRLFLHLWISAHANTLAYFGQTWRYVHA